MTLVTYVGQAFDTAATAVSKHARLGQREVNHNLRALVLNASSAFGIGIGLLALSGRINPVSAVIEGGICFLVSYTVNETFKHGILQSLALTVKPDTLQIGKFVIFRKFTFLS